MSYLCPRFLPRLSSSAFPSPLWSFRTIKHVQPFATLSFSSDSSKSDEVPLAVIIKIFSEETIHKTLKLFLGHCLYPLVQRPLQFPDLPNLKTRILQIGL